MARSAASSVLGDGTCAQSPTFLPHRFPRVPFCYRNIRLHRRQGSDGAMGKWRTPQGKGGFAGAQGGGGARQRKIPPQTPRNQRDIRIPERKCGPKVGLGIIRSAQWLGLGAPSTVRLLGTSAHGRVGEDTCPSRWGAPVCVVLWSYNITGATRVQSPRVLEIFQEIGSLPLAKPPNSPQPTA